MRLSQMAKVGHNALGKIERSEQVKGEVLERLKAFLTHQERIPDP
jgi:hypothetical protein